jgi:hypothetical protein
MKAEYVEKQKEYEAKKARAKALALRLTCTICGAKPKTLLNCPCGTTQYCSTDCQRIDWRERGHRKACKKIRNERAAEAARAEAPKPPPSPPKEVFYGPAPRSHADEVRARIAAEHEAARARREANPEEPERQPYGPRNGSRCPICLEDWDVNLAPRYQACCARVVCTSCHDSCLKQSSNMCPICQTVPTDVKNLHIPANWLAWTLAQTRRHVENEVPEAIKHLATCYHAGNMGLVQSDKKAAKLYKRAAELGNTEAMVNLGWLYGRGHGVKLDPKKKTQLYRMAADLGNAYGQLNLALDLNEIVSDEEGRDPTHAPSLEATKYFRLAAEQGLAKAQWKLAVRLWQGWGATVNRQESTCWAARAAVQGQEEAVSYFQTMKVDAQKVEVMARVTLPLQDP